MDRVKWMGCERKQSVSGLATVLTGCAFPPVMWIAWLLTAPLICVLKKISKNSNYALQTVNGSIEVKLPAQADLGTSFELSTSVGRIHADLGPLENIREKRGGGGAERLCQGARLAFKSNR